MKTLGNILWHVPFLGFVQAFLTWLVGGLLFITVIAAPIGRGLMEYAKFLMAPFSKAMVSRRNLNEKSNSVWATYSTIITVLYFPFGVILAAIAIVQIAALFATLVGIPVAVVLAKSLGTFFNPVNKRCVPQALADELERTSARAEVERHLKAT